MVTRKLGKSTNCAALRHFARIIASDEVPMAETTFATNGKAIAKAMMNRGFHTADDLAIAIDEAVSARSIQIMIQGGKKHKESTLQIIADALGVPLKSVLDESQEMVYSDQNQNTGGTTVLTSTQTVEITIGDPNWTP